MYLYLNSLGTVVRALCAFLSCSLLTTAVFTHVFIEQINDDVDDDDDDDDDDINRSGSSYGQTVKLHLEYGTQAVFYVGNPSSRQN